MSAYQHRRHAPGSLSRWLTALADLAMPPVCLSCQTPLVDHHALCAGCWTNIDFIRPPLCDRLGLPMPYGVGDKLISATAAAEPPSFDRARAVGVHAGTLKDLVHDFKFRDRQEIRRLFVRWLLEAGQSFWPTADLIIPVPLHRGRLLKRRFNQAALLGTALSRALSIRFAPTHLQRTRATVQQVGLTRQQRRDNVHGAFAVPDHLAVDLHQAHIVLVDDVITTGATVGACAEILRRAGAAHIDVLALALAVPGREDGTTAGFLADAGLPSEQEN